jgi:hypothetical protein
MRRSSRFAAFTAIGLTLWLSVTGCVTSTDPTDAASAATAGSAVTSAPATPAPSGQTGTEATGDAAPEAIPVNLVGGGLLDLAAYSDKPLLLWFWAPF